MKRIAFFFALLCAFSAAAQAQNCTRMLSGVNYQTGTSYTFQPADVTRLVSFSSGSAVNVSLPSGTSSTAFGVCALIAAYNGGTGLVTISCSACTINGSGNLPITAGQGVELYSDGTNYVAIATSAGGFSPPSPATFPGPVSTPGVLTVGPSSPAGIAAILWNGPDPFCLYNANGIDQMCDLSDPATGLSQLAWNPGTPVNQRFFTTLFSSVPYCDGQLPVFNGTGRSAGYFSMLPCGYGFNSQTAMLTVPGIVQGGQPLAGLGLPVSLFCGTSTPTAGNFIAGGCAGGNYGALDAAISNTIAYLTANNLPCLVNATMFYGVQFLTTSTTMLYGGQTPGTQMPCHIYFPSNSQLTMLIDNVSNASSFTDGNGSNVGTPGIIIPNGTIVDGLNPRNATSILPCGGANIPVSGCRHAFPGRPLAGNGLAVSCGSTTCTLTYTTTATLTGSGGVGSGQNIWPPNGGIQGEPVMLQGTCLPGYNVMRMVKTVPSSSTFTVTMPLGTSTAGCSTSTSGTAWLGTPLVGCGTPSTSFPYVPVQSNTSLQSFGCQLKGITLWGESTQIQNGFTAAYGLIGFQNVNSGEQSEVDDVNFQYFAGGAIDIRATDSGKVSNIYDTNLSSNTAVGSTFGINMSSPNRGLESATFILPYCIGPGSGGTPNALVSTSGTAVTLTTAASGCSAFDKSWAGNSVNIAGTWYQVASVASTTGMTLTSSAGTQTNATFYAQQPWSSCYIDGPSTASPNMNADIGSIHMEGSYDGCEFANNTSVRGVVWHSTLGPPNGAHGGTNLIHIMNSGFVVAGSVFEGLSCQAGGFTNCLEDDVNNVLCSDNAPSVYATDTNGHTNQNGCGYALADSFFTLSGTTSMGAPTQNTTTMWGITVPSYFYTSGICYYVQTADNSANVYDVGLYNHQGNLIADFGATAGSTLFASTGLKCGSWTGVKGAIGGEMYLAITSSAASPAARLGGNASANFCATCAASSGGTTSGGALNSSITPPADTWTATNGFTPYIALH